MEEKINKPELAAHWAKEIKDNQIKNAFAYAFFSCYFAVGSKIFYQIIGISTRSDQPPLFANLYFYLH